MGLLSSIGKIVGSVTGGDILGAAAPIVGTLIGGKQEQSAASAANAYTKEMMQNKHQWETEDLEKAGLNRILSANSTGGMGGSAKANVPDYGRALSDSANNLLSRNLLKAQIDQTRANTAQAAAQTAKTQTETQVIARDAPKGKFMEQAGNNILDMLDNLPPANQWLDRAASSAKNAINKWSSKDEHKPLRIEVRPSDRYKNLKKLGPPNPFDKNYIPMPPKL